MLLVLLELRVPLVLRARTVLLVLLVPLVLQAATVLLERLVPRVLLVLKVKAVVARARPDRLDHRVQPA